MGDRSLTRQIVVRVDDTLLAALKANAEANGRTVAQSARWLLRDALSIELQLLTGEDQ